MTIPLPCPDSELLVAIMRGRITTAEETLAIERHLAECAQCRAVADLIAGFDEPLFPECNDVEHSSGADSSSLSVETHEPQDDPAGE